MPVTAAPQTEGDSEDPSSSNPTHPRGFFAWLFGFGRSSDNPEHSATSAHFAAVPDSLGLRNLRELRVADVSVPKADIVSVPVTINKTDLIKTFRTSGLTRLPVYDETLDTPLGFIHLKDLALKHGFTTNGARMQLKSMLRPLLYVPPSMPIGVLLAKMQADRIHMALVIDEYGGTDGLVTIEDLIEQVIGEIEDEHDIDEAQHFTEEKPGCYLALSKTPLDDFEDAIGLSLTDTDDIDPEEIDTLGGLVFMLAGRVPAKTEVVSHPAGVEFEIVDADSRRIKRLRAYVPQLAAE